MVVDEASIWPCHSVRDPSFAQNLHVIADLLQHGLLKASYIPSKEQREIRDVVRYRKSLIPVSVATA